MKESLRQGEVSCHLQPSLHEGGQWVLLPTRHPEEVILAGGQHAIGGCRSLCLADRDRALVNLHEPASDAQHVEATGSSGMTEHGIVAAAQRCAFKEAPDGVG